MYSFLSVISVVAPCICICFSEQLCASELHGRRTSISSGEKIVSDLRARQNAYGRGRAESEPDPDRDIELELRALDMEDSDPQELKSQVSVGVYIIRPEPWIIYCQKTCY